MHKYTFILSTGRTGTLFFTRFFDTMVQDTLSMHEPPPSYHLRIMSNAHSSGPLPEKYLLPTFLFARRKILSKIGNRNYVEANNFLYGFSAALQNLEPAPVILHIVRDPREYIRSYLNHGAWFGKKWLAAHLVPYWQPAVKNIIKKQNYPITPITRFAAVWTHINRFLVEKGRNYPHYHLIRFEDIFFPPYHGLETLISIVGVKLPKEKLNTVNEKINPAKRVLIRKWHHWSQAECQAVDTICGGLMQEWGYGNELEWQEKIELERK